MGPSPTGVFGPEGYRPVELIGRGAFGEVWRAEAPGGIMVAVKILSLALKPEDARQELDALRSLKELRHPFLLGMQAIFAEPDRVVVVMELADTSLRKKLAICRQQDQAGLPPGELLGYVREAAEALDFLHAHNRLHRDIKPDNLLLVAGHLKVADYGLARVLDNQQTARTQSVVGTPTYMAPETWEGKVGPRSDQYSLAATYVELRAGRPPFQASSLPELAYLHVTHPPTLDGLLGAERQVLEKALSKTSAERYPTCSDFAAGLAQALEADRTPAAPTQPVLELPAPPAGYDSASFGTLRPTQTAVPPQLQAPAADAALPSDTSPTLPTAVAPVRRGGRRVAAYAVLLLLGVAGLAAAAWLVRTRAGTGAGGEPPPVVAVVPPAVPTLPDRPPDGASAPARPAEAASKPNGSAVPTEKPVPRSSDPPKTEAGPAATGKATPRVRPGTGGAARDDKETAAAFRRTAGIDLVSIPGQPEGTFFPMGSPEDDPDAEADEKPRHLVRIARPFLLGKDKVTVGQFRRFVEAAGHRTDAEKAGDARTWRNASSDGSETVPVVFVSWNDAVAFCAWLARETGTPVRLPREAEWEYSCRGGATTRYSFGDSAADLDAYAWYAKNSGLTLKPCGEKKPNAFGLRDMHGLAWEWCADGKRTYPDQPVTDPEGPTNASASRVLRGGSFLDEPSQCRAAVRSTLKPSEWGNNVGFRVLVPR